VTLVNLREFYEKDGKMLPGKAGIALKVEQFNALVTALPQIAEQLRKKGFEVPVVMVEETSKREEEECGAEKSGGDEENGA
jgi:Transcriptional Coactivator p15 (PC4)